MVFKKVGKRAISSTDRAMDSRNGVKSFASGLLFGLSSASLLLAGEIRAPKAPKAGLAADWKAVGGDIANAMGKHVR